MKYNWFASLQKRYTEGIDYSFPSGESRLYENLTWLNGDKPTLDQFNEYATQDTAAHAISIVRQERNKLLVESDVVVILASESGVGVSTVWKDYRQALRDFPGDSSNWSLNDNGDISIVWPTKPS